MAKLTLNTIGSRYGSIDALNDNFNAIEAAIENTLSRDGTSPNAMEADLDMNSNEIINTSAIRTDSLYINGRSVVPSSGVVNSTPFASFFFTATSGQTTFSVSPYIVPGSSVKVVVNGLQLTPASISTSGTNVVVPALQTGDEVTIDVFLEEVTVFAVTTPYEFTATAGQTTFTTGVSLVANSFEVYVDGLLLPPSSYSISGSSVVLSPLLTGQEVYVKVFSTEVAGAQQSAAETLYSPSGGTPRTVASKLAESVSLEDFGGSADGVTDNLAAFNAAVASGANIINFPGGNYYFSAGITIPQNVAVIGGVCLPTNPPQGTRLTFALSVATCVTLGGSAASNGSGRLQNVTVTRAAGTIPANSVGIKIDELYGVTIEDVFSHRHSIGYLCEGDADTQGIAYMFTRCWSGAITDAHVVIDTVPECRFSQCRFGMNGSGDQNCTAFIRVQGGSTTNPANGPNSTIFTNCQFNQGGGVNATNWLHFVNKTPGTISDTTLWQFDTCYVETYANGIASDASWASIQRLQINNCTFNVNAPFLNLNAGTTVDNWTIGDTLIFGSMTLAPTSQINFGNISNTQFFQTVSLTGPTSGSTLSIADCNFSGGLTLAGVWGGLQIKGGAITAGSLTNTATGGVNVDIYPFNTLLSFTPTLSFGGASTGITYSTQSGIYRVESNVVYAQLRITLTSKGAATGQAAVNLVGLPAVNVAAYSIGNSGGTAYALNMTGLGTSPISPNVGTGPVANLYKHTATGISGVLDTEFTNTSDIAFAVSYIRA